MTASAPFDMARHSQVRACGSESVARHSDGAVEELTCEASERCLNIPSVAYGVSSTTRHTTAHSSNTSYSSAGSTKGVTKAAQRLGPELTMMHIISFSFFGGRCVTEMLKGDLPIRGRLHAILEEGLKLMDLMHI